jgi:hypothetical protein
VDLNLRFWRRLNETAATFDHNACYEISVNCLLVAMTRTAHADAAFARMTLIGHDRIELVGDRELVPLGIAIGAVRIDYKQTAISCQFTSRFT